MPEPRVRGAIVTLCLSLSFITLNVSAESAPENRRCLSREQLNIEPLFSACPPLIDVASVSDNSFIAKLNIDGGPDRYTMRWRGPGYFNEDHFEYNPATGLYDGSCATRACSIGPGGWVQMEHWKYFVGTLLAENAGLWSYEEVHDGVVFQSREFDVKGLNLSALSGAEQLGIVDQNLPHPLVLKLESFEGKGIGDEVIGWSIDSPKGAKRAAVYGIGSGSETDALGVDSATVHLGSKPGIYTLTLNNRRVAQDTQPVYSFRAIDDIADTDPAMDHPNVEEGVGENRAQHCDAVGNPIALSLGNKFQREVDLESNGLSPIEFVRYHNSMGFVSRSFANYWTHTYDRYIDLPNDPRLDPVKVIRPDGKKINFLWNGNSYEAYPGIRSMLQETAAGWRFVSEHGTVEQFDAAGLLISITDVYGRAQTATYDRRDLLIRIEANTGERLEFGYDGEGRLATLTDQAGRTWAYRYESLGRLAFVDHPDGTTREYHYEDLRHAYALTGITTEDGQRFSHYEYDERGRAIASYHAGDANRVDIHYGDNGERVVLDPLANATVYETRMANKRGILEAISGPACSQGCGQTDTRYSHDEFLNVIRKTAYGITTEYGDYDAKGQAGYEVRAVGTAQEKRINYAYDPRFRNKAIRITEPSVYPGEFRVTTRSYDALGNPVVDSVAGFDPHGATVSRTINRAFNGPFGQLSMVDGPRTDVDDITRFEYYEDDPAEGTNRARLKAITGPDGIRARSNISYSATGKILRETRPNGVTIDYEYYPGNDRIKAVTESAGDIYNRTRWEYFPTGDVQRVMLDDETGQEITTQFVYDRARRLQRIESRVVSGQVFTAHQWVSFEFDPAGNVITERHESRDMPGKEVLIERVFDAYDRLDTLTQGGITVDLDYSPDGTLASNTDGNRNTTTYSYDAFKRLTRTSKAGQVTTRLEYDVHGKQILVTDPENHATHFMYDDLGNRVQQDSPDSGVTSFTYNGSGQVVSQTDAKGQESLLTYDATGRLRLIDRPGADYDVTYEYDDCLNGAGRLCAITTGWGHAIQYVWNALGELASVASNEGRVRYTWGPQKTLTSIEYPSGRVVLYELDGGGLPQRLRLRSGAATESILVEDIRYSALGKPVAWRFANGLNTSLELDARHRPVRIDVAGVWTWQADAYDGGDNLLALDTGFDSHRYEYDALGRLTAATSSTWSIGYNYDRVGNLLSKASSGEVEAGSYEAGSNRLALFGERQYRLDRNGNTTAILVNQSPARSYSYSSHDRLIEVTDESSQSALATYRYNALGQRVEKITSGGRHRYVYGLNGELLAELDGSGRVLHEYVYLDGRPLVDLHEIPDDPPSSGGGQIIIDNDSASVHGANWQRKSSTAAINGSYLQNRKRDNRAVYWYLDQPGFKGGSHDVYVRWLQPAGEGSSTVYEVRVASDSAQRVIIDHLGREPGDWVMLGNFEFAPAGSTPAQYVALDGFHNRYGNEGTFLEADAVRVVPTFIREGQSDLRFIHGDHLGTPQRVTDESGHVVWSASYLPFGEAEVNEDPDGDGTAYSLQLRLPGQYHDKESGLHYNHFRMYDAALGRYLRTDPIGLDGGINPFLYAHANPVMLTDPLGLAVRGEWIQGPRFNLQEASVDDWNFVSPSLSPWGYLEFVRLHGHASGYINIDVRCTEDCEEWEIHDRVGISAQGSIDVGPNLYAIGVGLVTRNPFAGIGANVALGGGALLQAELHFLDLARQRAGPLITALLADGPTLICLGNEHDDP
jgi:RHS repeat-associated protein